MTKRSHKSLRSVLGVLDRSSSEHLLSGQSLPVELSSLGGLELRADLLESSSQAFAVLEKIPPEVPVLFTLRLEEQGGGYQGNDADRLKLFRRALGAGATMVDAEWGSDAAGRLARESVPLVLSYHNFDNMPAPSELERISREMESLGPRIVKVVPTSQVLHDAVRMLEWVREARKDGPSRVGFAMGEKGLPSRVLSTAYGAPFTYGALGDAVAPGQPSVTELLELFRMESLNRATEVFGVIGNPVAHSLSPHMHNAGLAAAGINAVYLPVRLDHLRELDECWAGLRLRGLSVTVPFKEDAYRRANEVDERARAARAVNTLLIESPGGRTPRLKGYNTDFDGVLEPLRKRVGTLAGVRVAVLGNGGAARGAVGALKEAGAVPTIVYRNNDRGIPVAEELGVESTSFGDLLLDDYRVVINATSLGLEKGDPSPIPESAFHPELVAFDMVYDPPETAFLQAARKAGASSIGGGEMLVAQGLVQFRLFTGRDGDRRLFEQAVAEGQQTQSSHRRG